MAPKLGDIQELRDVLMAAKRANDFGRGSPDAKLVHIEPLIRALSEAIERDEGAEALYHQLMGTLKLHPVYPQDATQGADAITYRWVVYRQPAFHHCVELLRQRFPDVTKFNQGPRR